MALIRWDPFREFDRFFHEDWGFVPMVRNGMPFGMPAVDVYQTEKEVVAELEVPAGIDPEKIEVIVEDNTLTVRGATEEKKEEKERNYYRKEMRHGSFERTILLPSKVNEKKTNAHCEKGILKIVMPKLEEARKQKVQVTVKK